MPRYRLLLFFLLTSLHSNAAEWSGNISAEWRYFPNESNTNLQKNQNSSVSILTELYHSFDDSNNYLVFEPFLRIDQNDDKRSHADIRELYFHLIKDEWEFKTGISKVFWGVTETAHLVDIINQTDAVENIDGEDKLGQAMINLTLVNDWGLLDFFVLPYFRPRNYPDHNGRPQLTPLAVDNDRELYESDKEQQHMDWAIRWSHTVAIWDIGIAHFSGTSRDPVFDPSALSINEQGNPELIPIYNLIDQSSIDIQATSEAWLWKAEIISRKLSGERYTALAIGTEYTLVGIFESSTDLGIVAEYLYDDRDENATTPFENDLALGARFALNDTQSTSALFAMITDLDSHEQSYFIEATRRLGSRYRLDFELRGARRLTENSRLQGLRQDRFIQLELAYFF